MEPTAQDDLEALLREAENCTQRKDWDQAIEILELAARDYPESPLHHHGRAVVYFMRLREDYSHLEIWEDLADDEDLFETAVEAEQEALALDPEFTPALNNLGTLYALRGWHAQAVEQFEQSLSVDPEQPEVREQMIAARAHLE